MIDLFKITDDYTFRLTNLILIVLIAVLYFYGRRLASTKMKEIIPNKGIVFKGKEYSYHKLINQIILIASLFLLYAALGYDNPNFSLSDLLSYELLTSKNGAGFNLSLGQIVAVLLVFFFTKVTINLIRLILFKSFKSKDWIDDSRKYTIVQMSR